jgi:murein DD-endopeptidase MepM/ murein hydrolase activator NlpD
MVSRLNALTAAAIAAIQGHPRRIMGAVGALLLGTGVTAFGIAPLAPDAADLPVRQVLQSVSLATPATALDTSLAMADLATPLTLFRHDQTRRDDTLGSLLQRMGVNDPQAAAFLRADLRSRDLLSGRSGKQVSVELDASQRLQKLTARWMANPDDAQFRRLVVERTPRGFKAYQESAPLTVATRISSGTIQSSLFAATDAARIPDSVANQLAEIFSADIDFRRDLRKGDRFTVVYESLEADGEPMRNGRVMAAEFVNNGTVLESVWFQEPGSKGGYYTLDGQSKRRSYLAAPLEFTRVSSGYGMRFHPISGGRKPHLGVDYAAPTGTPVRVVGDGVVSFAGWQGGYGNFIVVEHRNKQSTAYAHLSRILVRKGQRVDQATVIGLVGSTGSSTGAHLHFEFRENGQHTDPLTIAKQGQTIPVSAAAKAQFQAHAALMRVELTAAAQMVTASAE